MSSWKNFWGKLALLQPIWVWNPGTRVDNRVADLCVIAALELASLHQEVHQSRKAAFAAGTIRNWTTQWKAYFMFCIYFNFVILPSSTNVVCLYVQCLAWSMAAFNSIQNYVSGIRSLHYRLGLPFPSSPTELFLLDSILWGLQWSNVYTIKQAAPMMPLHFEGYVWIARCL